MSKQAQDLTPKIKLLCDYLSKQKDPISGNIKLVGNVQDLITKFELGQGAMIKTLKVFYDYFKGHLVPKKKGFYPNCEVLEREYHYQNKMLYKKYKTQ